MIGYCWDGDTHLDEVDLPPNIVEFGAGSIPVRETLETFVTPDKLWPPDWDTWEYNGFFYNLAFNFAKVEMKDTLDEFIDAYQAYEALVVKEQIEYLRQRKYAPIASMYLYYWSDPCPIMGSGLLDYYRRPYQVYDAMKSVYTRVLVSLERDVKPYVIGREKVYERGTAFTATVWITNDFPHRIEGWVSWRIMRRHRRGGARERDHRDAPSCRGRMGGRSTARQAPTGGDEYDANGQALSMNSRIAVR
jgi:beta-mannosidase